MNAFGGITFLSIAPLKVAMICCGIGCVIVFVFPAKADTISKDKFAELASRCAPTIADKAITAIVKVESNFEIFAIGVNQKDHKTIKPISLEQAIVSATNLIDSGTSIDMGLGQINSQNFEWLGLSVKTVFDPCTNLQAAEKVLRDGYERARATGADTNQSYHMALSAYNTGSFTRGFDNGYVDRVLENSGGAPVSPKPQNEGWDVFAQNQKSPSQVFK